MKKSLFILALFLGLGNINAQSDATLEETITWLNSFGEELIQVPYKYDGIIVMFKENGSFYFEYKIEGEYGNYYPEKHKCESIQTVERVRLYLTEDSSGGINIGPLIKEKDSEEFSGWYFALKFKSKKGAERFYKALKHYFSFFPEAKAKFTNEFDVENKF